MDGVMESWSGDSPVLLYSATPSLRLLADPVTPEEEIDAVVQQVPQEE